MGGNPTMDVYPVLWKCIEISLGNLYVDIGS